MSRKAPNAGNGRRLRLMPLNILGGGPIIIDVDEEERKRQKRRLERAQAIIEAEALKQAQEQALAMVQAQAQQAAEEEQKKEENLEQPPSQATVAEATVPASPAQSAATIRIRESKDELLGTRTIEFRIDEKNPPETPDSKKEDAGDGAATAKGDGVDNAAASKPAREKKKDQTKKTAKKAAWVTYLDESGGGGSSSSSSTSSREDGDADTDDDTDVSTKADDGLEHHIRHLATRLCIGNDGDKPAQKKKATGGGASASKHPGRRRRRSSHSRHRRQMHFFSDIDNTRGTREVRLEAYSKKGDRAGDEERGKRQLDEKSTEAAAGEAKQDETSPSKDDAPRFLPAPPGSQDGQQDLAVNDPGDDHDVHRDRFLRSRSFRGHYLETLPPPPGRPAVDLYGHPVPSYAPPYVPYPPAYPPAYVPLPPPPPPALYPPYHAQASYAAYGPPPPPPPPPPEHMPYYYDHHYRRASDYPYAPAPYAPHAPTPPSPRSPARHYSSGSVHASGRPQRDGSSGQQQSRRLKNALPYGGGGDRAGTWHDPDAAGQAAGGSDPAWNKTADWETTNNKSKHAKGTKDQENNKSSNDLDNWGIRWDNDNNNENHDDPGRHKNKGKDAGKTSQDNQDNSNSGWAGWDAEENKSAKGDNGWPGWDADKANDMDNNNNNNNNSNRSWAGWGMESKKGDGNSGKSASGWAGWDTGSNEAKGKSPHGPASNNSNNGDKDNIWGLGGDGADDNNGAGDYAGSGAGEYAGDFARGGDANELWSGGNNMATMAEDDNNAAAGSGNTASAPPGAWPPSDGYEKQHLQRAGSSRGGNVAW